MIQPTPNFDFSNFNIHTLFSTVCGVFTYCILTISNTNPLKDITTQNIMHTSGINLLDEVHLGIIRLIFGVATALIIYYLTKKRDKKDNNG